MPARLLLRALHAAIDDKSPEEHHGPAVWEFGGTDPTSKRVREHRPPVQEDAMRRVAIVGSSGAGEIAFARALGHRLVLQRQSEWVSALSVVAVAGLVLSAAAPA